METVEQMKSEAKAIIDSLRNPTAVKAALMYLRSMGAC
jgi:hypothetical protein